MNYGLGVDLGTTFTAAAITRSARPDVVELGDRAAAMPSVVAMLAGGGVLVGDPAVRRGSSEPSRVARAVKRRFGDPTPLILGGEQHSASEVLARLLSSVVTTVAEREGGAPETVVLTHPASWGPYKRDLFAALPRHAGVRAASMISEPEAAAIHYASHARLAEGAVVAVYDLGGGTFDATVLRKLEAGFELLGPPEGVEGLGGLDFDEAVFAHVDRSVGGALVELDLDDPGEAAALVQVRRECVLAKEALSADTRAVIPVLLPGRHTEVRLTRTEMEEMIRPSVETTVASLRAALSSARVEPDDLSTVLLVGGSSRIPLISRTLSGELGRPTAVDTHPKHAVALGAALVADGRRPSRHGSRGADRPPSGPRRPPDRPTASGGALTPGSGGDRTVRASRGASALEAPTVSTVSQARASTVRAPALPATAAGSAPPSLRRPRNGEGADAERAAGARRWARLVVIALVAIAVLALATVAVLSALADDTGWGVAPIPTPGPTP